MVEEIKVKNGGDLDKLQNALESSFTYEDLEKIVVFQMNEKIVNISANDFKFKFTIEGKLNKDITSDEVTREFELSEIDTKANCKFSIKSNKEASLSCDLNVEKHKDIETFSFKTAEIKTDKNEIYLAKFNDIVLLNSKEKEDDDNNKKIIIIIIVVCAVIGAGLIALGIYCLIRHLKAKKMKPNVKRNIRTTNNNIDEDDYGSGNRVIPYKNK